MLTLVAHTKVLEFRFNTRQIKADQRLKNIPPSVDRESCDSKQIRPCCDSETGSFVQ